MNSDIKYLEYFLHRLFEMHAALRAYGQSKGLITDNEVGEAFGIIGDEILLWIDKKKEQIDKKAKE